MIEHRWDTCRPVFPGAGPARGMHWGCSRCGMTLRSNQVPESVDGYIYVSTPGRSLRLDTGRHPVDCDRSLVMFVMES